MSLVPQKNATGAGAAPVFVTNTSVPVSVNNFPNTLKGTSVPVSGSVGISGNVPVVNPLNGDGKAELVFVDDNDAARHSFTVGGTCTATVSHCDIASFLTVQSGQVAVVTDVNALVGTGPNAPTGADVILLFANGLSIGNFSGAEGFFFPVGPAFELAPGAFDLVSDERTTLYLVAQPNQPNSLDATCVVPGGETNVVCAVTVVGYFVNQ